MAAKRNQGRGADKPDPVASSALQPPVPLAPLPADRPDEVAHLRAALAAAEQRAAEAERRATETEHEALARAAQLEAVFDAITDGVYVYDADGHLLQTNQAARAVNPQTQRPDYLARSFAERISAFQIRDEHGQPLAPEATPIARVLRGEVLTGAAAMDTLMRRPEQGEILLNTTGAPVRDTAGNVTGAVIVTRDVTERRRLERRTHEALDALLAMAETLVLDPSTDGAESASHTSTVASRLAALTCSVLNCQQVSIATIEPETEVMRPLALVGFSPEQERIWWAGWQPDTRVGDRMGPAVAARLRANEMVTLDATQPPHRDRLAPYEVASLLIVPIHITGKLLGALAVNYYGPPQRYTPEEQALAAAVAKLVGLVIERDRLLGEREAARASALALEQANRRMDEFLGIASHELRTPITVIKASLQMLARRHESASAGQGASAQADTVLLARVQRQLQRVIRLVDDLLDVSRIRQGRLELHLAPSDLLSIVREVVEEQRHLAPGRTVTLSLGALPAAPVQADADRIAQVLTNFLTNALKYSPEDRQVAVSVRQEREPGEGTAGERMWVRVQVRDEGQGIPAEQQAHIWNAFHRVPGVEVQSGSGIGLGLGLHITREIVERHGGQVGVESVPGEGATFWFALPLHGQVRIMDEGEPAE